MKTLWARISMELEVSDEEFEKLREQSRDERGRFYDVELDTDLAQRFLNDGELSLDSYIPGDLFEEW